MPHYPLGPICTAASIHLAAASPNFSRLEELNTGAHGFTNDPKFYPVQPKLDGSRYPVLDTPGLGVEVNEALAQKNEFIPVEIPRLRKNDGSFAN